MVYWTEEDFKDIYSLSGKRFVKSIAKSYASPSILAELIMGKYMDHRI